MPRYAFALRRSRAAEFSGGIRFSAVLVSVVVVGANVYNVTPGGVGHQL
jgi:hypothetical protein